MDIGSTFGDRGGDRGPASIALGMGACRPVGGGSKGWGMTHSSSATVGSDGDGLHPRLVAPLVHLRGGETVNGGEPRVVGCPPDVQPCTRCTLDTRASTSSECKSTRTHSTASTALGRGSLATLLALARGVCTKLAGVPRGGALGGPRADEPVRCALVRARVRPFRTRTPYELGVRGKTWRLFFIVVLRCISLTGPEVLSNSPCIQFAKLSAERRRKQSRP